MPQSTDPDYEWGKLLVDPVMTAHWLTARTNKPANEQTDKGKDEDTGEGLDRACVW